MRGGGSPGCAWCVYEAAAGGAAKAERVRPRNVETAAPRRGTRARCACPERANAMLGAGCRSCFTQSCSDRAARSAGKAFLQTSQDSLGWVGGLRMSTVPRRAGGTPFFRHVHLKAGIEVPRAPLVAYGKERCAPAAPREERGPGAPLAASAAARSWPCGVHAHAFPDGDDLRRRGHGTTSRRVRPA